MSKLHQGRIVRATVCDPTGGNPKVRPLVIVSADTDSAADKHIAAVAITSKFDDPPKEDDVSLPWHRDGLSRTKLRKMCVAKCYWLCQIKVDHIVDFQGVVPPDQLALIIERLSAQP